MHLAVGTKPDIAFAVSTLAQFSSEPGPAHWEAVKQVFRYPFGMKKLALTFGAGTKQGLEGFTDVMEQARSTDMPSLTMHIS